MQSYKLLIGPVLSQEIAVPFPSQSSMVVTLKYRHMNSWGEAAPRGSHEIDSLQVGDGVALF